MQLSMGIDRLHVVQDLFGDKSSRGFLALCSRSGLSLIYFHLIRRCMLLPPRPHARGEFLSSTGERVGDWLKTIKWESVQQQRLLMIPHGHSSTFVSFSCPRNSLIISSQLCAVRALSRNYSRGFLCILMNRYTKSDFKLLRKINIPVVSCEVCVKKQFKIFHYLQVLLFELHKIHLISS